MTTYNTDQTNIYNNSASRINDRKKKLLKLYQKAKEDIENKIAAINIKQTIGLTTSEFQEQRLNRLLKDVDNIIRNLKTNVSNTIITGAKKNFTETYLDTGYNIEREINLGAKFKDLNFNASLNYPFIPEEVVEAALFDERVAGMTFKNRILQDQKILQFRVREQVAQAVLEGISTMELADRLELIDEALRASRARSVATARTEMLRAYSIGQEEAIDLAKDAGVEGTEQWRSTLDSKTRKSHVNADLQKAQVDKDGNSFFLVGGVALTSPRIVAPNNTVVNTAAETIQCRCRKLFLPFGISPTKRTAKLEDGAWIDVPGNTSAKEWRKALKTPDAEEYIKSQRERKRRVLNKQKKET